MDEFDNVDQDNVLWALVQFLVHLGADIQHLDGVHAGALTASLAHFATEMEGRGIFLECPQMVLNDLLGEKTPEEALNGAMAGDLGIIPFALRDDRE
jgi:hypothetical protein